MYFKYPLENLPIAPDVPQENNKIYVLFWILVLIQLLISEIKDLINEKTHFVKDGTKIIKEVEESADEEIQ